MKNKINVDLIMRPDTRVLRQLNRELTICKMGLIALTVGFYWLYKKVEKKKEERAE